MTLPAPQSSLDYKVWAFGFYNNSTGGMFAPNLPAPLAWNTPTYSLHSIVPMIGISSNVYNGYREPGTDPPGLDEPGPNPLQQPQFSAGFSTFKNRMLTVPSGRRAINMYYWWVDISIFTKKHYEFYKNTSDGTVFDPSQLTGPGSNIPALPGAYIPENDRILTPWLDTNLIHNKQSTRSFLQRCISEDLSFDYLIDDKEAQDIFWINGRNSSTGSWLPPVSGSPYPTDPQPNVQHRSQMPDARFASAIAADPRFTTYVNPRTGKTFAEEFIDNYKLIANKPNETRTWQEILAPLINIPIPTEYVRYSAFWVPWGSTPSGTSTAPSWWPEEIPRPDGFDIFHHVIPAWNATADAWHWNYYIDEAFLKVCKEFSEFENVKYSQYEVSPVSHEDAKFKLRSNGDLYFQKPIPEWYVGASSDYYCDGQNVLYIGGTSLYPAPFQNRENWLTNHARTSGYVNNPVVDREKYAWNGFYQTSYGGEAGAANLVKYPEANPWATTQYSQIEADKFYRELCFKFVVNGVMRTRFGLRADPTMWQRFAPWITTPTYYNGPFSKGGAKGYGYWYEVVYHLCVSGVRFFNLFSDAYGSIVIPVNDALNEWRTVSQNSRAIPCSNTTGDINAPIDRVVLHEVFNNVLMSGGKLEESGQYIWRITVPPKFFNEKGICTLKRQDASSDIPEFITINYNGNIENSFGTWVTRSVATPPQYSVFQDTEAPLSLNAAAASLSVTASLDPVKAVYLESGAVDAKLNTNAEFANSQSIRLGRAQILGSSNTSAELAGLEVIVPANNETKLHTYGELSLDGLTLPNANFVNCMAASIAEMFVSPSLSMSPSTVNNISNTTAALTIFASVEFTTLPAMCKFAMTGSIAVMSNNYSIPAPVFTNNDNVSTIEKTNSENVDTFLKANNAPGYDSSVLDTPQSRNIELPRTGFCCP
jgi:hypothetical protein